MFLYLGIMKQWHWVQVWLGRGEVGQPRGVATPLGLVTPPGERCV